jgi:transcriptional regulator with GAF, ATPase, and Fis domain
MARHLSATAGTLFASAVEPAVAPRAERAARKLSLEDERLRIADALRANGGNVTATARALGLHRTQLRRLLARHQIVPSGEADDAAAADEDEP